MTEAARRYGFYFDWPGYNSAKWPLLFIDCCKSIYLQQRPTILSLDFLQMLRWDTFYFCAAKID
jgi:hypothetical protein